MYVTLAWELEVNFLKFSSSSFLEKFLIVLFFTSITIIIVKKRRVFPQEGSHSIIELSSLNGCLFKGFSEYFKSTKLVCHHYKFFTHGGMIFLFTTSVIFAIVSTIYRYFRGVYINFTNFGK